MTLQRTELVQLIKVAQFYIVNSRYFFIYPDPDAIFIGAFFEFHTRLSRGCEEKSPDGMKQEINTKANQEVAQDFDDFCCFFRVK
jgi:hypothetical protein